MLLRDIQKELKKLKIPMAYYEFPIGNSPAPPYILYYDGSGGERGGDLSICINGSDVSIELYANNIDLELEKEIKKCLRNLCLEFEFDRERIEKEEFWKTTFDFRILHKEEVK